MRNLERANAPELRQNAHMNITKNLGMLFARYLSNSQWPDGTDWFQSWHYHAHPGTGCRHFDSHR